MRPRREVLLTTFADPSTFPSVFESPETPDTTTVETQAETTAAAPADSAVEAPAVESPVVEIPAVEVPAARTDSAETPSVATETAETPAVATETAAVEENTADAVPTITFGDLGLPAELVRVLAREGITTPFEIQTATVPDALAG